MSDDDESFLVTRLNAVLNVFNQLPLAGFSTDQDIGAGLFDDLDAVFTADVSPTCLYGADDELGVSDDAQGGSAELRLHLAGEGGEGSWWEGELLGVGWVVDELLPA